MSILLYIQNVILILYIVILNAHRLLTISIFSNWHPKREDLTKNVDTQNINYRIRRLRVIT